MKFESYHPVINLIYFTAAIVFTIWFNHPVFTAIAYVCAFIFSVMQNGKKALIFNCLMFIFIAIFTYLYTRFMHFGATELGRNFIGNRITLESAVSGLRTGFVITTVIIFLSVFFSVFSTDKVIYVFGRISPKLSLFISVLFRSVPRIKKESAKLTNARFGIGMSKKQGGIFIRLRNGFRHFFAMIGFTLENFFESSQSMKNRGYSLKGRTAYSIYRFDDRDRAFVIIMFFAIIGTLTAFLFDQTHIYYDPVIIIGKVTPASIFFYMIYAAFLLMPVISQMMAMYRFKKARAAV